MEEVTNLLREVKCKKHGKTCMLKTSLNSTTSSGLSFHVCSVLRDRCDFAQKTKIPHVVCINHPQNTIDLHHLHTSGSTGEIRHYYRCAVSREASISWCGYSKIHVDNYQRATDSVQRSEKMVSLSHRKTDNQKDLLDDNSTVNKSSVTSSSANKLSATTSSVNRSSANMSSENVSSANSINSSANVSSANANKSSANKENNGTVNNADIANMQKQLSVCNITTENENSRDGKVEKSVNPFKSAPIGRFGDGKVNKPTEFLSSNLTNTLENAEYQSESEKSDSMSDISKSSDSKSSDPKLGQKLDDPKLSASKSKDPKYDDPKLGDPQLSDPQFSDRKSMDSDKSGVRESPDKFGQTYQELLDKYKHLRKPSKGYNAEKTLDNSDVTKNKSTNNQEKSVIYEQSSTVLDRSDISQKESNLPEKSLSHPNTKVWSEFRTPTKDGNKIKTGESNTKDSGNTIPNNSVANRTNLQNIAKQNSATIDLTEDSSSEGEITPDEGLVEPSYLPVDGTGRTAVDYRAIVWAKLDQQKHCMRSVNMSALPDKGEKIRQKISDLEQQLKFLDIKVENESKMGVQPTTQRPQVASQGNTKQEIRVHPKPPQPAPNQSNSGPLRQTTLLNHVEPLSAHVLQQMYAANPQALTLYGGRMTKTRLMEVGSITRDAIDNLHQQLESAPAEEEEAPDPEGLRVSLFPHQRHALAWLTWREKEEPPGGILADDMGLGKTLTMISLIVMAKQGKQEKETEGGDTWSNKGKRLDKRE